MRWLVVVLIAVLNIPGQANAQTSGSDPDSSPQENIEPFQVQIINDPSQLEELIKAIITSGPGNAERHCDSRQDTTDSSNADCRDLAAQEKMGTHTKLIQWWTFLILLATIGNAVLLFLSFRNTTKAQQNTREANIAQTRAYIAVHSQSAVLTGGLMAKPVVTISCYGGSPATQIIARHAYVRLCKEVSDLREFDDEKPDRSTWILHPNMHTTNEIDFEEGFELTEQDFKDLRAKKSFLIFGVEVLYNDFFGIPRKTKSWFHYGDDETGKLGKAYQIYAQSEAT